MKQWVKKHDRYEPIFSDAALEWSAYYDTTLETCRVRAPRDKGAVEGLVRKVYNAVYAPLHHEVFHTLESLNNRIFELMDAFNSKPSKVTGRSRIDVFKSEEQRMLGILPQSPYRFRYRKEVKLTGTYHIQIDKHKYSVPYQYVGQIETSPKKILLHSLIAHLSEGMKTYLFKESVVVESRFLCVL